MGSMGMYQQHAAAAFAAAKSRKYLTLQYLQQTETNLVDYYSIVYNNTNANENNKLYFKNKYLFKFKKKNDNQMDSHSSDNSNVSTIFFV